MIYDRLSVDFFKVAVYAAYKFLFAAYAYAPEHLSCHLAEETFNQIEPRSMLWGKHKFKPSRNGRKVFPCILRRVNPEVIQHKTDLVPFRVPCIKQFEEIDIIPAVVGFPPRSGGQCQQAGRRFQGACTHNHG